MGYRLGCPSCDAWTSAVFRAYGDGENCPYCGGGLNTPENSRHYYEQLPDDHHRRPQEPKLRVCCPACRHELSRDISCYVDDMGSYVRYRCSACGFRSQFDFDAPVPLYLGTWPY